MKYKTSFVKNFNLINAAIIKKGINGSPGVLKNYIKFTGNGSDFIELLKDDFKFDLYCKSHNIKL